MMIEIGPNLAHLLGGILFGLGCLVFMWMMGYWLLKIGGLTRKW